MLEVNTRLRDQDGRVWLVGPAVEGFADTLFFAHDVEHPGDWHWLRAVPVALDPDQPVAFQRRASAICGYGHAALPRGVAWGIDDARGVRFLVLKPRLYTPLSQVLGQADAPQVTLWFEQLGTTLREMHQQGLAHCGLSLDRVGPGDDGLLVLGPWGFPMPRDPSDLPADLPLPTECSHLPPEMLGGPDADARAADVYAFGQMLHESLTGSLAYELDGRVALLEAKQSTSSLDPGGDAPPQLRAVVQLATSVRTSARPDMTTLMQHYAPPGDGPRAVETDWAPMAIRRRTALPELPPRGGDPLQSIGPPAAPQSSPELPSTRGSQLAVAAVLGTILLVGAAAGLVIGLSMFIMVLAF